VDSAEPTTLVGKIANRDALRTGADLQQLGGYVQTRAAQTGRRYTGILTDGAIWGLYHARKKDQTNKLGATSCAGTMASVDLTSNLPEQREQYASDHKARSDVSLRNYCLSFWPRQSLDTSGCCARSCSAQLNCVFRGARHVRPSADTWALFDDALCARQPTGGHFGQ
jgi:hypothetical protein